MNYILLTADKGKIIGPFVSILGKIFELIYNVFSNFGIESIALCIIIFTLVVRIFLFPMQLKQQKFTKINSAMAPEIQKIQKRYEKKKDQESQMAMQQEISAVYRKYGVSPAGSCLQLLIQMPILLALYRVIYNIPAYVGQVKDYYITIISKIPTDIFKSEFSKVDGVSDITPYQLINNPENSEKLNKIIDIMSRYDKTSYPEFNLNSLIEKINSVDATSAYEKIKDINSFFFYNLSETPSELASSVGIIALTIPILACVFQFLSTHLITKMNNNDNTSKEMEDNPMMSSLKTMNFIMPFMSAFFCYTFLSGIGLYWVTGSVLAIVQQFIIMIYFKFVSVDDIVAKSMKKAKKKNEKRGIYENMINEAANKNTKYSNRVNGFSSANEEKYKAAMEKYKSNNNSNMNSISSRANMVRDFNNKNK